MNAALARANPHHRPNIPTRDCRRGNMNRPSRCRAAAAARPPSGCKRAATAPPGTSPRAPGPAGPPGGAKRSALVIPPGHPVRTGSRIRLQAVERRSAAAPASTWCSSAVNRASLSLRATSRTRSSPFDTPGPALRPGRVSLSVFPTTQFLSSPASSAPHLVRQARRYYELIRLPAPVHPGITAEAFPRAARPLTTRTGGHGTSRFSRMKVPYMPGSLTARGPPASSR